MNSNAVNNRNTIIASLVLGLALIICAFIASSTFVRVKGFGRAVTVTGAAIKPITSDFAIWEANVTADDLSLEAAYATIKTGLEKSRQFLIASGFADTSIEIGTVQVNRSYDREGRPAGYTLYQSIKVHVADVDRITLLARESSSLIEQGVAITTLPPKYVFTKLEDLKIEMIKAATENAKLRAEQLAKTTGKEVGAPLSARIGVFQIRPLYSQEVSDYGVNDMSSIQKEVVSTVNISFLIE
ncbi:MAG: SIMPL domain-containing protein [candidate division Zixibacteria bacterium]|nr:SIMPL domain-containing protein [candidate division Zixibacteria bacterium]